MDIINEAKALKSEVIDIRRKIHMRPELGMEEVETSRFIKKYLDKENIEYKEYAKTGVCGIIKGNKKDEEDKVIALRADIDALPIIEKTNAEYSSTIKGKMHACGHDGHTAILLCVAKILNRNKDFFAGTVKLIFEPAEETVGGARYMIEEGILDNPAVDAICGLHLDEDIECGKIKVKYGEVNAASNPFKITVTGVGGHGAYPANAIDPIVIASSIVTSLQNIVSREINPLNSAVITVGSIHGGTAANIIPEEVTLSGIIRTLNSDDRKYIVRRVDEIVNGIGLTLRGKIKIDIEDSYPPLINNNEMVEKIISSAQKVILPKNIIIQDKPKMGVESFAYFAEKVPSVFYFLGCRNTEKGIIYPAHSGLFDIDEESLAIGIAIQAQMVIDYLTS